MRFSLSAPRSVKSRARSRKTPTPRVTFELRTRKIFVRLGKLAARPCKSSARTMKPSLRTRKTSMRTLKTSVRKCKSWPRGIKAGILPEQNPVFTKDSLRFVA
jgi:hypothetical protein